MFRLASNFVKNKKQAEAKMLSSINRIVNVKEISQNFINIHIQYYAHEICITTLHFVLNLVHRAFEQFQYSSYPLLSGIKPAYLWKGT